MRLALALLAASLALACQLPSTVRYLCESDRTCAVPNTECRDDGYCHPVAQPGEDGGQPCDPSLDLAARCAEVECGMVSNGCGDELDCEKRCQGGLWCGTQRPNACGLPTLCSPEGWCWENPLPQGYTLNAGFRLDARHTWFVGENRTVLRYDGEQLVQETPAEAPGSTLNDVHGTAPDEVYAVGRNGLILHRVDGRWEVESIFPTSSATLRAVWSLGGGQALAGGSGGAVFYRVPGAQPGDRWRQVTQTLGSDVVDLAVDSAGVAFALTRTAGLFQSSGDYSTWTLLDVPPFVEARQVLVRDGALYLSGSDGSGRTLQRRTLGEDAGYTALVTGASTPTQLLADGELVWGVTGGGVITVARDDTSQSRSFNDGQWAGGALVGPGAAMVVGLHGAMGLVRADAGTLLLSTPRSARGNNIGGLCGSSPEVMFAAAGREGTSCTGECLVRFARREASAAGVRWQWEEARLGGSSQLHACFALGPEDFWMPGDDSKFVYWGDGPDAGWGWGDFTGTYSGVYTAGWGQPDAGYYFTRTSSRSLTWSPTGRTGWQGVPVGLSPDAGPTLRGVWGVGGDDIVTVGQAGTVSRFDGTSWVSAANVASTDFLAVHGARLADGTRRYVAVGTNGVLLSNLGDGGPSVTTVGAGFTFRQAWVSGASGAAWAVGNAPDGGAWVVHSALDQPWNGVPFVSSRQLTGVFGFDEADGGQSLWVAGPHGMVLRRR